jgi:hypothetical protein
MSYAFVSLPWPNEILSSLQYWQSIPNISSPHIRSGQGLGLALAGLARERPRFDLTMKKPGAEAPGIIAYRAVRGVRRVHPGSFPGLLFNLIHLQASECLGCRIDLLEKTILKTIQGHPTHIPSSEQLISIP